MCDQQVARWIPFSIRGRPHPAKLWVACKRSSDLHVPDKRASRDADLAPIELFEDVVYEWRLRELGNLRGLTVVANEVIAESRLDRYRGTLKTASHVGLVPFTLLDADGLELGSILLKVRSRKIDYEHHYRVMLEQITEWCTELILHSAPSRIRLTPDWRSEPRVAAQRLAFLESLLDSDEFESALARIVAQPHERIEGLARRFDLRHGSPGGRGRLRLHAGSGNRVVPPPGHRLHQRLAQAGHTSLPSSASTNFVRTTTDTEENRFVRYCLEELSEFLQGLDAALAGGSRVQQHLARRSRTLRENLDAKLDEDLFKSLSPMRRVPAASPVLQRKAGYRTVLRAWTLFHAAANLSWHATEDTYTAGVRDAATLYEYWVFFQMLGIAQEEFQITPPSLGSLLTEDKHGFQLRLRAGARADLMGRFTAGARELAVRLSFNRTFGFDPTGAGSGSWTRQMRPDYTFSFWGAERDSAEEAEAAGDIAHIHFDAKYKVDGLEGLFGPECSEMPSEDAGRQLDEERKQQGRGTYKRADLLKMHAYRDAIRRTEGAYVVYPGLQGKQWREYPGYHELLPGLGAFRLRPEAGRPGTGTTELRSFLVDVAHLLSKNDSRRTRARRHLYECYPREEQDL